MVLLPYSPGSYSAFFQPRGSDGAVLSCGLTSVMGLNLAVSLLIGVWYLWLIKDSCTGFLKAFPR